MRRLSLLVCALLICASCSEPPQKEIDTAQGAIEAARAAGAEEYAAESFNAATSALRAAHDAVAQGDYRLALSRALDARERAQESARLAADGKARQRSESEAAMRAVGTALEELDQKIKVAESAGLPPQELAAARQASEAAGAALQKARAAVDAGSYLQARDAIKTTRDEMTKQISALDEAIAARTARPPRRPRGR